MSSVLSQAPGRVQVSGGSTPFERCPLPVPYGWFFVSYSEELKAGEVRNIQYFGQEWVMFRSETGEAGVVDPVPARIWVRTWGMAARWTVIRCAVPSITGPTTPRAGARDPLRQDHAADHQAPGHPQGAAGDRKVRHRLGLVSPARRRAAVGSSGNSRAHGCELHQPARGEWPVNTFIQELGENGVDFAHLKFLHHAPIIPTGECRADGIHWTSTWPRLHHHRADRTGACRWCASPRERWSPPWSATRPRSSSSRTIMRMSFTHRKSRTARRRRTRRRHAAGTGRPGQRR